MAFRAHASGRTIQFSNLLLRTSVGRQIRQVHVMIAVCEEHVPDRGEHPMLGMAKGIVTDHIQGIAEIWAHARSANEGYTNRG